MECYNITRGSAIVPSSSRPSSSSGFFDSQFSTTLQSLAIGAEYGEGFETFRPDGPLKVDVDFLNGRLQEGFLQRIRYAMKPDEAFGLIFSWDNVVILNWKKSESGVDLLKLKLSQFYHENLLKVEKPLEGLEEWLEAVSTAHIPCAVVSSLDRRNMVEALEKMKGNSELRRWPGGNGT